MNKLKVLVVVDMQNDFLTGSLANPDAVKILPRVVEKVKAAKADPNTVVIFTMDTHHKATYLNSIEGKNLPVEHCTVNTDGWKIVDELMPYTYSDNQTRVTTKTGFGCTSLISIIKDEYNNIFQSDIEYIELIGVCTDICVIANAFLLKSYFNNTEIIVDASCCAGVTKEYHNNTLEAMKRCHINIINEDIKEEPIREDFKFNIGDKVSFTDPYNGNKLEGTILNNEYVYNFKSKPDKLYESREIKALTITTDNCGTYFNIPEENVTLLN